MRNCPVCEHEGRASLGAYQAGFTLHECAACGMRYLDANHITQDAVNNFYAGDTSPDLHGEDSITRLRALADCLQAYTGRGVDIGGKYCYELREWIPGLEAIGAGEALAGEYDYFILSHTLEHVYDVPGLMREIAAHAKPGARIVIEVPVWLDYSNPFYDFHFQHLNKFTAAHLGLLLNHYGWTAEVTALPDFQEYHCARAEGVCGSLI